MHGAWTPMDAREALAAIDGGCPLDLLAEGTIPAIVFRAAYSPEACGKLLGRLIEREELYDPDRPVPAKFLERSVPEGSFAKERVLPAEKSWRDDGSSPKRRIDVGTSLGNLGFDKERFLAHSAETHQKFRALWEGLEDPVRLVYERLESLAGGRKVVTAREPDGRLYGPAIVRAHYGGYAYKPHFDSVRLREGRRQYAVYAFEHQFAGVLVLQNAARGGETAQCILHRCPWTPEVDPHLSAGTFHEFARERGVESTTVALEPGDLYFFNTRMIHEVPGVEGRLPRIVLATFIGYSRDRAELFVWS